MVGVGGLARDGTPIWLYTGAERQPALPSDGMTRGTVEHRRRPAIVVARRGRNGDALRDPLHSDAIIGLASR
jgi:hypothetical protein